MEGVANVPKNRRWELIIFLDIWLFHIAKKIGKNKYGGYFLVETWVGPICLRVWENPKSASIKLFRIAGKNM